VRAADPPQPSVNSDGASSGENLTLGTGSEGGSRPRPCENVCEPRKCRTSFSIAFIG
jgi:hypothetical protein